LVFGAVAGAHQPVAQSQRVFRLLVAPVGGEPGPAAVAADQRQDLADVIRKEQLDGAKRLDDVGDGRVEVAVTLVPGDVVAQVPAPAALGLVEEVPVDAVDVRLDLGTVLEIVVAHAFRLRGGGAAAGWGRRPRRPGSTAREPRVESNFLSTALLSSV